MSIRKESFGKTSSGKAVAKFVLENAQGMRVSLLDYGCVVQAIEIPLGDTLVDVACGYDDLAGYEAGTSFAGAFVGRYANRIKDGAFELNGKTYQLSKNSGNNHLHGTFSGQVFESRIEEDQVVFSLVSPDGEEGYPGRLSVEVRYRLTEENGLEMEYRAQTDAPTVLNFTNHSYFNLNGQDGSLIYNHNLVLAADSFTETSPDTTPTGRILDVSGTPMDFRTRKSLGQDIHAEYEQLTLCSGYDHNFIVKGEPHTFRYCGTVDNEIIRMDCFTTQPGVQVYTANFFGEDGAPYGKNGVRYPNQGAVCLETQHYPCSPNFPEFPTTMLNPGENYCEKTVYRFTVIMNSGCGF